MTDLPHPPAGTPSGDAPAGPPDRRRWQVGLRTVFLLVAAIAVWMTYVVDRRHNAALAARIAVMRPLARELVIDDEDRIAVVKLEELWYDENRWEVYLPDGSYRLCLATREISPTGPKDTGLAPVVKSARLGAGRHDLALEQQRIESGWRVTATWDGTGRLVVEEPAGWDPGSGSTGGGEYSVSTQQDAELPAVLFRRIFSRPAGQGRMTTPSGPAEGILLWIEREDAPEARPRAGVGGAPIESKGE